MTQLSVNVNKIAWLRNARDGAVPSLIECCSTIVSAGCTGLTVHPRPDQRHITPEDVLRIRDFLIDHPNVEFNIEGNPNAGERDNGYPGFAALVEATKPDQCTLVPDDDGQLTSDHGWNLKDNVAFAAVKNHVLRYRNMGVRTSIFLDPDLQQIELAKHTGVDRIELYTGPWVETAEVHGLHSKDAHAQLRRYWEAANHATKLEIGVNAGHDLNQKNVALFCSIGNVKEVSIGHALISEALLDGLETTVKTYLRELSKPHTPFTPATVD